MLTLVYCEFEHKWFQSLNTIFFKTFVFRYSRLYDLLKILSIGFIFKYYFAMLVFDFRILSFVTFFTIYFCCCSGVCFCYYYYYCCSCIYSMHFMFFFIPWMSTCTIQKSNSYLPTGFFFALVCIYRLLFSFSFSASFSILFYSILFWSVQFCSVLQFMQSVRKAISFISGFFFC